MSGYESVIFIAREVYVFLIPPVRESAGYRAKSWKVDEPLWTGRLRMIETALDADGASGNMKCEVRLENNDTGELFATAPYKGATGVGVEQVIDSSRFFVLKVVEGDRHAYLGMGFKDRSESFDFNIALQEHRRQDWLYISRHCNQDESKEKEARHKDIARKTQDYSLKQGQTIVLSFGQQQSAPQKKSRPSVKEDASSNQFSGILPPPPSAAEVRERQQTTKTVVAHDEDDFGDFA
ncbi:uncharacterized protein V1516DRAFT_686883 [Lipomyces oligophaga]|uniref:uncharacterized protein n=1 Tax=Lipomyces oligophaga TaxID=45792 RepID=UPI0034CD979E